MYIDGEEIASTNERGQYQLLNVTTGQYSIKVYLQCTCEVHVESDV